MAFNNRVFWACTAILFCNEGQQRPSVASRANNTALVNGLAIEQDCVVGYGIQSVGITTTFNLEQVFELGQIGIYENIEEVPDIEVTVEKVLDGTHLLYDMATYGGTGANVDMVTVANVRKDVWFTVQSETNDRVGDLGVHAYCSGMYVSSFSYTFPNEGNCTESITLVGNDKIWMTDLPRDDAQILDFFHVVDVPGGAAVLGWGAGAGANGAEFGVIGSEHVATEETATGVQRRENVNMATSIFPTDIWGSTGTRFVAGNANTLDVHLASVTISGDLGRENIQDLGHKVPYYRYVTYPIEVTTDIEVTTVSGDIVDASSRKDNLLDQEIYLELDDGTDIWTGTKNKLQSVTYAGGDTGGGNATCTYSYVSFNAFQVDGPEGPP